MVLEGSYLVHKASLLPPWLQAMHQWTHWYQLRPFFVPGNANKMVDKYSCLWHLSDSNLVAYFNANYPQSRQWQLYHLDLPAAAVIVSALSCIW